MKLDKRHLVASVALLVGSILYNVWIFTRPASGTSGAVTGAPARVDTLAPPSSDTAVPATLDPSQVKPLPDVVLNRLPRWPRDPFASLRPREVPVVVAAAPAPPPAPEPDPVVASILYSSDRRLAMIDGRVARVGDVIGSVKVVDILPNAVIVESRVRGRRTLMLKPPRATR